MYVLTKKLVKTHWNAGLYTGAELGRVTMWRIHITYFIFIFCLQPALKPSISFSRKLYYSWMGKALKTVPSNSSENWEWRMEWILVGAEFEVEKWKMFYHWFNIVKYLYLPTDTFRKHLEMHVASRKLSLKFTGYCWQTSYTDSAVVSSH